MVTASVLRLTFVRFPRATSGMLACQFPHFKVSFFDSVLYLLSSTSYSGN